MRIWKGLHENKINSDDDLPLNKLNFFGLTIIVRPVFEDGKYYPQIFLDECLYNYKNATV